MCAGISRDLFGRVQQTRGTTLDRVSNRPTLHSYRIQKRGVTEFLSPYSGPKRQDAQCAHRVRMTPKTRTQRPCYARLATYTIISLLRFTRGIHISDLRNGVSWDFFGSSMYTDDRDLRLDLVGGEVG